MSKPVFKFCIHRTIDGVEVYEEIGDVAAAMIDTAYEAYLRLPWYKRISASAIADNMTFSFLEGFDEAIERLKERTVRL